VCKLDVTLTQYYDRMNVLIGTVEAVQPEARLVVVKVVEALKGQSPGPRLRVQIASPGEMIKSVAAGQPIVLFLSRGQGAAAIHVADTWVLASAVGGADPPAWRVVQRKDDLKPAFPGRTEALVRLLGELKAGRRPTIDRWDHKPFAAGARQRAKLPVQKPAWLLAADVNGDKKPDLLAGSAAGTRLLLATAGGYQDATAEWGNWGEAGGYHAAGEVNGDGRADFLLDGALWINDGRKFVVAKVRLDPPRTGRPLAAAVVDVTGDARPDAVFLSSSGELRIFENPGSTDRPWPARAAKGPADFPRAPVSAALGDFGETGKPQVVVFDANQVLRFPLDPDGGPPDDFGRLTGVDLRKGRFADGLRCRAGVALHMDADRRCDLLALGDRGALLLVNRGFGFFFVDDNPMAAVSPPGGLSSPIGAAPGMVCAAADLHGHGCDDLLLLAEDGTLFELDNGPQ
jgi:hypothetical protein